MLEDKELFYIPPNTSSTESNSKSYNIHNNYKYPFIVKVEDDIISIYKYTEYIKPKNIFVGKSDNCQLTEYSGAIGEKYDGNTILLHLGELNYKYIGHILYNFKSILPITDYKSPIGNNDLPYPYAIDSGENIYLFLENKILLFSHELKELLQKEGDPYSIYYKGLYNEFININ